MNPLLVSITHSEADRCLTKYVPDNFKQGNFERLVEFMVNPNADEFNPGYNAVDGNLYRTIKGWFDAHRTDRGDFALAYVSTETQHPITISLDTKLNTIVDMFHQRNGTTEGFDSEYEEAKLVCEYFGTGGC